MSLVGETWIAAEQIITFRNTQIQAKRRVLSSRGIHSEKKQITDYGYSHSYLSHVRDQLYTSTTIDVTESLEILISFRKFLDIYTVAEHASFAGVVP